MRKNPLKEYIDDSIYETLWQLGFLNERAVRDHYIRQTFRRLKKEQPSKFVLEKLQSEFPYLSIESIRKIAYSRK